jgi:hypothetical protein
MPIPSFLDLITPGPQMWLCLWFPSKAGLFGPGVLGCLTDGVYLIAIRTNMLVILEDFKSFHAWLADYPVEALIWQYLLLFRCFKVMGYLNV